jgi:hypothetical protein
VFGRLKEGESDYLIGVVAQLVERLICIQEAWGSTPHNSIFLTSTKNTHSPFHTA